MPHISGEATSGAAETSAQEAQPTMANCPQTRKRLVPQLNISTFEYPVDKVVHTLFGVKVKQNEYTKELEQA